jgi:hypothetical protein
VALKTTARNPMKLLLAIAHGPWMMHLCASGTRAPMERMKKAQGIDKLRAFLIFSMIFRSRASCFIFLCVNWLARRFWIIS